MRFLEALLIGVITAVFAFLTPQWLPAWIPIAACFGLVFPITYYAPLATAWFEHVSGEGEKLPFGIYAELYQRGGVAHVSILRHRLSLRRRRSEIYGVVFNTDVSPGAIGPHRIGHWRSHYLNFSNNDDSTFVQYFYTSSDGPDITGVTKMNLEHDGSGQKGFFSDIRSDKPTDVVNFDFVPLRPMHDRVPNSRKKEFSILAGKFRRAMKDDQFFDKTFSFELATMIVENDADLSFLSKKAENEKIEEFSISYVERKQSRRDVESESRLRQIREEIQRNLENAHCEYSGVKVSAAVEDDLGDVHYGVNVENAAFPSGTCAEGSAISAMITNVGNDRRISRVYLTSSLPGAIWPCGACRQRISEFADEGCEVYSISSLGDWETETMDRLLPNQFVLNR